MQHSRVRKGAELVLFSSLAVALSLPASGQCQVDDIAPDPSLDFEQYGTYLVFDPNDPSTVMVGAPQLGTGTVAVLVDSGSGYVEVQRLSPSDGAAVDTFGTSIAIDDVNGTRTALIGSPLDDDTFGNSGSVYVFEYDGTSWQEVDKLHATEPQLNGHYGQDVRMDGNQAIVGAARVAPLGSELSQAYVYANTGSGWVPTKKLVGQVGGDAFGYSVDIDGDYVAVGAHLHTGTEGAVYVFARTPEDNWIQIDQLAAGGAGAEFGNDVQFVGDTLIVGSWHGPGDDFPAITVEGAVYMFQRDDNATPANPLDDTYPQVDHVWADDAEQGGHFGTSIAAVGNRLLVGCNLHDNDSGETYLFEQSGTTWTQTAKLTRAGSVAGDFFGLSVALCPDGSTALVGAPHTGNFAGSVSEWQLDGCVFGATTFDMDAATGGTQAFSLDGGPAVALQFYWILGSANGTSPGILGIPLNFDNYFQLLVSSPNLFIVNQLGFFDAAGQATATVALGPLTPSLVGVELNHAYVAVDAATFTNTLLISNPVHLLFQ